VIADLLLQDRGALVEGVEVHVKGIDLTVSPFAYNDRRSYGSIGFARGIWLYSL
jgi:hypothetical protein